MKNLLFFLSIISLFIGCEKHSIKSTIDRHLHSRVQFSNLQEGQQSFYARYSADCAQTDFKINWTGDTLSLRVVKEGDQFFFEESLTKYSTSYTEFNQVDTLLHPIEVNEGNLLIPERGNSQLFYFYGNDTLKLDYLLSSRPQAYQSGCRIILNEQPFEGEEIAFINKFELGGGKILQQDRTVVSCVPVILALEGYLMYDFNELYLSHTYNHSEFVGVETIHIEGWQLIED